MFARIFVTDPNHRIAIEEIQQHHWYLRNLPPELAPVRRNHGGKPGIESKPRETPSAAPPSFACPLRP